MAWFERSKEVEEIAAELMAKHHPTLHAAGVTVRVLMARSEDGHPLKVRGIPAAGVVRINSLKARAEGLTDATITLDGEAFPDWTPKQMHAVLDHELTHLELAIDKKTGKPAEDDLGRPKLRMRMHDHEFGWFDSVAARWGADSFEHIQARDLLALADWMQPLLPGMESVAKPKRSAKAG